MNENKIAREVAEKELERFLAAMDIEDHVDEEGLDKEEVRAIRKMKRIVIRALEKGRLVIDDDGLAVYTTVSLKEPVTLTFRRPNGAAFLSGGDEETAVASGFRVLAEMTGVSVKTFATMGYNDLEVLQSIAKLFFG